VVFDLDGTLIDSRRDIARAANAMLVEAALPQLSEETIASFVGDGARLLVARATGRDVSDPALTPLVESFLSHYAAHPTDHTRLMPGASEALAALAHLPLAICTNKPRVTTELVLSGLGLARYFRVIVAGGDVSANKPDPLPLLTIGHALGVDATDLVMVGDGPQDIECGRAAGARTIGVRGGILAEERLLASRPDVLLNTLHELPAVVADWQR
jgi:phosphoglycolate phosphatase